MKLTVDQLDALSPRSAETVEWALEQIAADTPRTDRASLERFAAPNWRTPARVPGDLNFARDQIGKFEVRDLRVTDGSCHEIEVVGRKARLWLIRLHLDPQARITRFAMMRPVPDTPL